VTGNLKNFAKFLGTKQGPRVLDDPSNDQKDSANGLPSATLAKAVSTKNLTTKEPLPSVIYRALGIGFCRVSI